MAIKRKIFKNIIFLFVFFPFVKLKFETIIIDSDHFENQYYDYSEFKIKGFQDSYLKITVEGSESNVINHVISYYQNENLIERKQLSQSLINKTIMWLTQEQIENDFYITIECAKKPCSYKLLLDKTQEVDLNLNDQYTYYVTEENKNMKFKLLKEHNSELKKDPYVLIWVRGNKYIQTELTGGKSEINDNHSYYEIKFNDYSVSNYYITINGEIGDLINVGLILYNDCILNICNSDFTLENGEEITSYLKSSTSEIYKVKTPSSKNIGFYYDFNNKLVYDALLIEKFGMKSKTENLFYTLQFLNSTNYDDQGNNKYSPLLDGIYNIKQIEEKTTIGLIPMKPKDNFKFLTYEVFPIAGELSLSIYECDNYPLCHLNEIDNNNKIKKIDNYQSYYYTYKNDEWQSDISPISKKQNILLITCEKGLVLNKLDGRNVCSSSINMKTDKKLINITDFNKALPPYQRLIKKNNVDTYFLKGTKNPIHLSIEIIAGNIKIVINHKNYEEIENKKFYIIESNKDTEITIKGLKNSIYSISDNYIIQHNFQFHLGYNYLLKLGKKETINLKGIEKIKNIYQDIDNNHHYYIKINPLNCNIKIKTIDSNNLEISNYELTTNDIYQEKLYSNLRNFTITEQSNNDNCLFYISSYIIKEDIYSRNGNGISMGLNKPQSFIFNKDNNEILFSFPYINSGNDVEMKFTDIGENSNQYSFDVKVNEKFFKEDCGLKEDILLRGEDIIEECHSEYICKIIVRIVSEDKEIESKLNISVYIVNDEGEDLDEDEDEEEGRNKDEEEEKGRNEEEENNKEDPNEEENKNNEEEDNDNEGEKGKREQGGNSTEKPKEEKKSNKKKTLAIVFSILGVVIIIVVIVLVFYLRNISKNNDLNNAVNQISFKDNDKNNDDDEIGDSLLD